MAEKIDTSPAEALFEKAEEYSKETIQLMWLNAVDKSAEIISTLLMQSSIIIVLVMGFFTLNIGLAFWIGERIGIYYYGFFAVAAFYLFIAILLYLVRVRLLKTPISNAVISRMLKQKIK